MVSGLVKKTAEYVRKKLSNDHYGQDWFHTQRVWRMATQLQTLEGGNLQLIELAALLHDVGDYKHYDFNEKKGSFALRATMDILDIDTELQQKILETIQESEYKADETKCPATIEGKILQDAKWLDCLGAIGVARTFAEGGSMQRVIHDPSRKVRKKLTKKDYQERKREGTSINHFYEKILKLPDMINTGAAKEVARRRLAFIEHFLDEFVREWEGER